MNTQCIFDDGEYTLTFDNCDELTYTFLARVCGRSLNICINHECDNRNGFNLDTGDYRVRVLQGNNVLGVYMFKIYPTFSNY